MFYMNLFYYEYFQYEKHKLDLMKNLLNNFLILKIVIDLGYFII